MDKKNGLFLKRVARLVAVQFMYQMEITDKRQYLDEEINDFINAFVDDKIDKKFLRKMVANLQNDIDFDKIIKNALEDGKDIMNSSLVEISVIKTALTEILFEKTDIPIIINEYVEIAKDFLDMKSVKFINALLDKASKKIERRCLRKT